MNARRPLRIVLATPRGFCAGVERAINIVEAALSIHGPPVYVRHEIVHNRRVVEDLERRGAVFVDEVDDIPAGSVTVFSAHGVSRQVEDDAAGRRLDVIDATCPLVRKVHKQGRRYAERGYDVVLIGHRGHAEVIGTTGQISGTVHLVSSVDDVAALEVRDRSRVAYVTQTTLSVTDTRDVIAALVQRFPDIIGPDVGDICYATQNRQNGVAALAKQVGVILVVGANNSSNSQRLREIAENFGVASYLVERPSMVDRSWIDDTDAIGITAGASAPDILVREVIGCFARWRDVAVETLDGVRENVTFRMPDRLAAPLRSDLSDLAVPAE